MSRKDLQKDKDVMKESKDSRNSKNNKGAKTKSRERYSKNSEAKEGTTNRLGSIVDITKFIPVGYPSAPSDVVPINFGSTLSDAINIMKSWHNTDGTITDLKSQIVTPGICALDITPVVGPQSPANADTIYNAINECANSMYAHIRMSNAGGKNYDPSDLIMYVYAVSSAYAFHGFLRRLYGVIKYYNYFNNYTPDTLIQACGWANPGEIRNNLTAFRDLINTFGRRLSVFPVPVTIPIVDRMAHLFDDVYLDSNSERAQMYVFRPSGFYIYDETQANTLKYDASTFNFVNSANLNRLVSAMDAMLQPILQSQSLGEIKRDILATYPASSWYVPEEVSPDYMVFPKLDYNVLLAIHNCTVVPDTVGNITVNPEGKVVQEITHAKTEFVPVYRERLIDLKGLDAASVNAGAVLMGTMFTSMWDGENFAYSPEIVKKITIYKYLNIANFEYEPIEVKQTYWYTGANMGTADITKILSVLPFDYFPCTDIFNKEYGVVQLTSSLDSYRVITCDDMMRINRMKMEGLFGLPYHVG